MAGKVRLLIAGGMVALSLLAGCDNSGGNPAHHESQTVASKSPSPSVTPPAGSSLSVACHQAYAALSVKGWGLAPRLEVKFGCRRGISLVGGSPARTLSPPSLPVTPVLTHHRSFSCTRARTVLGRFSVFPKGRAVHGLATCANEQFIADVLPVTSCPVRGRPQDVRRIMTGNAARQWVWPAAGQALLPALGTLTSVWVDNNEARMAVQVGGGAVAGARSRGAIYVGVFRPCTLTAVPVSGKVSGYEGRGYVAPRGVGPITLKRVTGTLARHDLVVYFAYPGGSGVLNPETRQFTV